MAEIAERPPACQGQPALLLRRQKGCTAPCWPPLRDWLTPTHGITPEADPASLGDHVRAKMRLSQQRPPPRRSSPTSCCTARRWWGAAGDRAACLVLQKAAVLDGWMAQGRMAPVDTLHLFFSIWAMTQTYADFEVQIAAVLGQDSLGEADHERATRHVTALVLRGCGLQTPPA
jgi:TetR/AcrR family transcriptional regulator